MQKRKIALIVDADNWAFANIAKNFKNNLSNIYDMKIIPSQYFNDNIAKVLLLTKDCELIHFFWRGKLLDFDFHIYDNYIKSLNMSVEDFRKQYFDNKIITTAVYDHLYLETDQDLTKKITDICDMYYVSSSKLYNIYNGLNLNKYPQMVITDGINLKEFYPINLDRFKNIKDRNIVIGWVGNSAWSSKTEDYKGVNTIIKPAIEELKEEGYKIETYFADRQERMIPHDEMVNYYSKIDLYICASKTEGTPNPVFESMACAVPIISTDVGIVNDAFGKKQKEYILEERSKECLKNKIKMFIDNLDKVSELSEENLEEIKNWTWKNISRKAYVFFEKAFQIKK